MRFKYEGKEYEWDVTRLTVEEAMLFQDKANLGLRQLNPALVLGNPYATITLVFLAKKRAGEAVRWQDLLQSDIATYEVLPAPSNADSAVQPPAEDGPKKVDPTSPGGKIRKAATTATT